TDAHLSDRRARHAAYGHHVARTGRGGDQWLQRIEIDHLHLVIRATGVCSERDPLIGTLLLGEPLVRALVGREQSGGGAGLHDHVADGAALGRTQRWDALAEELEDTADATPHAPPTQQLEHDVLGLDPRRQPAAQVHADHPRCREAERLAGQTERDVKPTRSDGQHAQRPGHGGVAIGANQNSTRTSEPLQVDVVTDPVAWWRVDQSIASAKALQVTMVILVLPVQLDDVVIDVLDRERHVDAVYTN